MANIYLVCYESKVSPLESYDKLKYLLWRLYEMDGKLKTLAIWLL